jgi:hypothetical protein
MAPRDGIEPPTWWWLSTHDNPIIPSSPEPKSQVAVGIAVIGVRALFPAGMIYTDQSNLPIDSRISLIHFRSVDGVLSEKQAECLIHFWIGTFE